MRQVCCICGCEDDELFMHRIQTSRVRWMCGECYKTANDEVAGTLQTRRRAKWIRAKKAEVTHGKRKI